MSAPATGRWLIIPRIGTGTRRLATQLGRWHAGHGLGGRARVRAVLGRLVGALAVTWFIGGMLWALGTPPWAIVPMWLTAALTASYRDAQEAGEQAEEAFTTADFVELLHDLSRGANLHLSRVREQLAEETGRDWTTQDVTALCRTAGVPTRPGVRVPGATPAVTTGIHRDDLPPLPRGSSGTPVGVVGAGQHPNNNTNTPTATEIAEGVVIVTTGPSIHQEAHR
jgi:hypothetical protein